MYCKHVYFIYLQLNLDSVVNVCCRTLGLQRNIAPHRGFGVIPSVIYYYYVGYGFGLYEMSVSCMV